MVNNPNVGVDVKVVRGSLAVVGEQDSTGVLSFDAGVTSPSTEAWFPAVTTANAATPRYESTNPNDARVTVSASVSLAKFKISPQSVSLPPYSSGVITITPNSAIPAAGYASVTVRSSEPVVSGLATGTGTVDRPCRRLRRPLGLMWCGTTAVRASTWPNSRTRRRTP